MTRAKKEITKKKSTLYMWLGLAMLLLFGFFIVMHITHSYIENVEHPFLKMLMLLIVIIPIILGLYFNFKGTQATQKLLAEKKILNYKRDIIRVRHFWIALKNNNFKRAKELYNQINDNDNMRFANGIVIGVSTQVNMDNMWNLHISDQIEYMLSYPE
jgi:hypothetical protein